MNKRIISMMLVLTMLVGIAQVFAVHTDAAATLTITQPYDGEWISYSDAPRLEWNKVDGAAGYRISIRNLGTDELVVDRAWTTKTYYKLNGKLDAAAAEYRIWVGAMYSKNDDNLSSFTSSTITVHTTPEVPEIDGETWEDTTYNSVILSMEITRDNGNAITDSGFYIVESGLPTSDRIKYSFKNNGSYSATTKGYKKMTITGLKPDTKYYFWAYAINGVGETITSRHAVTTDEYNCPHTSGVYTNTYPESISYVNIDDGKQHKEIWYYHQYCKYCDKVVKEKAVSETNYGDHEFTDGVCKLCKYKKTDTGPKFNQGPTLTLSIDGNKISGDIYGTYVPGDVIYFNFKANYSDHVFVEASNSLLTFTNPEGTVFSSGTFVEKTSSSAYTPKSYTNGSAFQIAINVPEGIPAGDYTISVTATDGVYDGDSGSIAGTSYYDSVKKCVTVRIGEKTSGGDGGENSSGVNAITTLEQAKSIVLYSTNSEKVSVKKGYVRHMPQITGYANFYSGYWVNDSFDLTTPYNENNIKIYNKDKTEKPYCHELCSRAVYSMALSYIGIDVTPVEMSTIVASRGISGSYGNSKPYNAVTEKLSNVKHIEGSLDALYNNYINNDNYSPVYFHFSKPHCVLIIGQKSENVYYVVDPSVRSKKNVMANEHVYEMTLDKKNKKVVSFSYNGKEIFTDWSDYDYSYIHQWYIVDEEQTTRPTTYTITYNYNHEGGSIKTEAKNHDEVYTISNTIIPTRPSTETSTTITSYSFYGWATSEDGDVVYQPGDTYTQNSNLTLYAQWTASISNKPQADVTVYGIFYDANGGSNAPEASDGVKAGTTITLSTAKPTRSGYTFIGWSLDKNDDTADYQPGDSYTVTGATTLYAVWKAGVLDINTDGEIDKTDVTDILKHIVNGNVAINKKAADVNGDGKVTVVDAIELMLTLAAKSTP